MDTASSLFFTYQPFWKAGSIKEERILADENGTIIAKACQYQDAEDSLCVPGIGLTCISFPCGKDAGKTAYCYGPVQQLERQPMYGVQCTYSIRFLPGAFRRYFRISNSELPSHGIPLTDLMPDLRPFIPQAANAKDLNQFCLVSQRMLHYLSGRCRNNSPSSELTWLLSLDLLKRRQHDSTDHGGKYWLLPQASARHISYERWDSPKTALQPNSLSECHAGYHNVWDFRWQTCRNLFTQWIFRSIPP